MITYDYPLSRWGIKHFICFSAHLNCIWAHLSRQWFLENAHRRSAACLNPSKKNPAAGLPQSWSSRNSQEENAMFFFEPCILRGPPSHGKRQNFLDPSMNPIVQILIILGLVGSSSCFVVVGSCRVMSCAGKNFPHQRARSLEDLFQNV